MEVNKRLGVDKSMALVDWFEAFTIWRIYPDDDRYFLIYIAVAVYAGSQKWLLRCNSHNILFDHLDGRPTQRGAWRNEVDNSKLCTNLTKGVSKVAIAQYTQAEKRPSPRSSLHDVSPKVVFTSDGTRYCRVQHATHALL